MPPRAPRKARAVSASLQGKSAGQEAPQLLAALPAYQQQHSGHLHLAVITVLCICCLSVVCSLSAHLLPVTCLLSTVCGLFVVRPLSVYPLPVGVGHFACQLATGYSASGIGASLHGLLCCTYMLTAPTAVASHESCSFAEHGVTHASAHADNVRSDALSPDGHACKCMRESCCV